MNCNQAGLYIIKSFETCRLAAYQDPKGIWTIGWGHTGPDVTSGLVWTQQQADEQIALDVGRVEQALTELISVPVTSNQFSSLCSFVYNIGIGAFVTSGVRVVLNENLYEKVPDHMLLWDKCDGQVLAGLQKRRAAEIDLWKLA